jgi:hypothetical protein
MPSDTATIGGAISFRVQSAQAVCLKMYSASIFHDKLY